MKVLKLILVLVMTMLITSMVSAVDLGLTSLKINGEEFGDAASNPSNSLEVKRGEDLTIKLRVRATADVSDVQIEADIYGYRYAHREADSVSDVTKTFDLAENVTSFKTLELKVPSNIDKEHFYLRVRVADRYSTSYEQVYDLFVSGVDAEDAVIIKDYSFSPSNVVAAGRAFTTTVRVQNIGDDTLDDVKVTVEIPELNVKDSEYLDELSADEKETLDEFLLRIPDCAAPGVYEVEITAEFDEYESSSETASLTIVDGDTCGVTASGTGRTVVSVPENQDVAQGTDAVYPLMITNQGSTAKTYAVTLSGLGAWGSARMEPSSVTVVEAGETSTIYLYVSANDDANSGTNGFKATISSDGESKDVALTANVVADNSGMGSLQGLEIALVVLVIILIIIGLIIGFSKLRNNDDDDEGSQTYY